MVRWRSSLGAQVMTRKNPRVDGVAGLIFLGGLSLSPQLDFPRGEQWPDAHQRVAACGIEAAGSLRHGGKRVSVSETAASDSMESSKSMLMQIARLALPKLR